MRHCRGKESTILEAENGSFGSFYEHDTVIWGKLAHDCLAAAEQFFFILAHLGSTGETYRKTGNVELLIFLAAVISP